MPIKFSTHGIIALAGLLCPYAQLHPHARTCWDRLSYVEFPSWHVRCKLDVRACECI